MHSLRRLAYLTLSLLCLGALAACNREAEPPVTTIDESPVDQGRLTLTNTTVTVDGETPPGLSNDWLTMSHIAEIPVQAHPEMGKPQDAPEHDAQAHQYGRGSPAAHANDAQPGGPLRAGTP